jgi:hypothetical protein
LEAPETATQPPKKQPKGFQPGNKHGIAGRPASGMQSFKDRLARWTDTKTVGEIERLIKDKKAWNNLLSIDAMVAMRVSEAYERGGGASMTVILDRLLGKPPQAITGEDGAPLVPATDIMEIARRTAFLLSLAATQQADASAPLVLEGSTVTPKPE